MNQVLLLHGKWELQDPPLLHHLQWSRDLPATYASLNIAKVFSSSLRLSFASFSTLVSFDFFGSFLFSVLFFSSPLLYYLPHYRYALYFTVVRWPLYMHSCIRFSDTLNLGASLVCRRHSSTLMQFFYHVPPPTIVFAQFSFRQEVTVFIFHT